jgi:hypothetical protein
VVDEVQKMCGEQADAPSPSAVPVDSPPTNGQAAVMVSMYGFYCATERQGRTRHRRYGSGRGRVPVVRASGEQLREKGKKVRFEFAGREHTKDSSVRVSVMQPFLVASMLY